MEIGRVVENYRFAGFANPLLDKDSAIYVEMADFYNPTGTDVYPEGSPYGAGSPKPKALLINVSAVWCGPCNYENDQVLPVEYAKYAPRGAQFFLQLADGPTVGTPAKFSHLVNWTTKYDTAWPAVIDPSSKLSELFEANAFPANIIIDTKTMTIVDVIAGAPEAGSPFFTNLESLIDPE
ncbi:MAG: TlpA family protein disulfide reductase [Polyangiaceae bacterium]|nr:TlpA family protein disulfide reductase [Polyangiaceae bacterium]